MRYPLLTAFLGSMLAVSGTAKEAKAAKKPVQECSEKPSCCALSCCCHPCLEYPVPLFEVYDNCGPGFGVRGDVLYMNYTPTTLSFASEVTVTGGYEESHIHGPTAEPNVGCEIALTYTMCNDPGYTFEAAWYHIVAEYSKHLSGSLVPAHIVAIDLPSQGTAQNNGSLAINFWDLVLRKDYRWGQQFTISPTAGIIGGYMHIENKAHFTRTGGSWGAGVSATDIHLDQDLMYKGIGARLGSNFEYKIWKGFKFLANFYFNALYGYSDNELDIVANAVIFNTLSSADSDYKQHHGRTFFDSLLGLSWETTWCGNALWTEVHAGWRYQHFSEGWTQFEAELNNAVRQLPLNGQGLQAGLSIKY